MVTSQYRKRREAAGRYLVDVRSANTAEAWQRIPGLVIGGSGRWCVQLAGNQWPQVYSTADKAVAALVERYCGSRSPQRLNRG